MGPRVRRRSLWTGLPGGFIVVASLALAAFAASAASLGGITTQQIFAQVVPASAPIPAEIAFDDFSCNGDLDGQTTGQGHVWVSHWGGWQCLGGNVVRSRWRLPLAHASIDIGRSDDLLITAELDRVSTQTNRSGPGIALFTDGLFHMYAIVELDQNRVTLGKWSPWANIALTSVPISFSSVDEVSVAVDHPSLTVLVNGVQHITFDLSTLPQNEQDQFLGQTRFGLEADMDNWSRFRSFRVETLP